MIALVTLIYAIKEFTRREGSVTFAVIGAAVGIMALVIFIRRQNRSSDPLIDLSLFKIPLFTTGFITALVGLFAMTGIQYIVTQRLQLVEGFSPLISGVYTLTIPFASVIAAPVTGMLLNRFKVIYIKSAVLFLTAVGLGIYLVQLDSGIAGQVFGLTLFGAGLGGGMTVASHSIMSSAPYEKAGMAASMESVGYEVGGATGIAMIGSLSGLVYTLTMKIPTGLNVPVNVKDSLDEALIVAERLTVSASETLKQAARFAFDQSFSAVIVALIVLLLVASLSMLWIGSRSMKKAEEPRRLG
ncbi:MFS transporter [Paenibacillus amylolyticus]|uniref:MFS transporter n=1 Tax=Paenibacillus amylolyticus TaxID=1451 RepID=UPI001EFF6C78|nr:MFS transporter [Paenibacillus amylolyticus]